MGNDMEIMTKDYQTISQFYKLAFKGDFML